MEKKETYLNNLDKKLCMGCTACKSICPKGAINMVADEEGFLYPKINKNKCVGCRMCEKVCPLNVDVPLIKPKAYSYYTQKEKDLLNASSGGAFGDIIDVVFDEKDTIVYGCIFDENNKAIHIGINNREDIDKLKKSKYLQSNLLNVYNEVKENLLNGKKVVFSGTPCQISGLKNFLGRDFDNLFLIDIICHGVPSQKLLDYYLDEESIINNSKVVSINFREKIMEKNGQWNSRNIKLIFDNGKTLVKGVKESAYLIGFHNRLFYRPSCYECRFAKKDRLSDITIADCWGIEKIDSTIDPHRGVSCVIVNTVKGHEIFDKMKGIKNEIPLQFVIDNNDSYNQHTKMHINRNSFFNDLKFNNFGILVYKYTKISFFKKVFRYIKRKINNKLQIKKYKNISK